MMVEFVHWCVFYYDLASSGDGPDEDTMLDDVKLDMWLKKRKAQRRKEEIERRAAEGETSFDALSGGKKFKSTYSFE